jgi:hypothetical protein
MLRAYWKSMRRPAALTLALALAAPAAASAQDGVVVDPGSPTGKEYAIPLESARRQADSRPDNRKLAPGDRSAEPFGVGVTPESTPEAAAPATSGTPKPTAEEDSSARQKSTPRTEEPAPDETDAVREAVARAGDPPGGSGTLLLVGGIATAICAGAAFTGLALRRRGPSPA